ncbi:putative bifunctional diguanylate cyclase/phosphodiesterase [Noviherbaspirillum pedocola]|uniref:EAL domain-containing protein n=1 Tax=Noviherbaspirillum pedocola TaxID=2801341 RepID=A0A934W8W9_9BURK|nr:EAL domain-containing protein [Noviherbaspirillum pedocola]MBK4736329.1 EAL domain-containing protein [Noviherbaspirillum pedocola]
MLYWLSAYIVPISIGALSLIVLVYGPDQYPAESGKPLAFRAYEEQSENLAPQEALARLAKQPAANFRDTHLSEQPFWLAFEITPEAREAISHIDFPSRHTTSLACWDATTMRELGAADRRGTSGGFSLFRAGFVLSLPLSADGMNILCREMFKGPARAELASWTAPSMAYATRAFERYSGLLDGGLIVLALFVLITAMINRESTYLLFSAWLLVNLRLAGLSTGWDVQWLGHTVSPDWVYRIRGLSAGMYYVLTFTLFRALFRDELARLGYRPLLKAMEYLCVPLIIGALLLPYKIFLPFLWASTAFATSGAVFFLTRILLHAISPVALLYAASLSITLMSSLYEVISASFGLKGLIGTVNFVTAALSSSLLAALAIAAQLRTKHLQWMAAQAELQHTYNAMPIGLFTLDLSGHFIAINPAMCSMLRVSSIQPGKDAWSSFFDADAWQRLEDVVRNSGGELEIGCNSDAEGERRRFLVRAALSNGKIEGSLQDITARAKATEELQFMAHNDPLTKVLNRRGIDAFLEKALGGLSPETPLLLAYLDLDRFKLINDLYGHPAGDEVLRQVCERIKSMLTGEQRVGRVGGDEFVIVFPDIPPSVASWVCRGIVESIGTAPYHYADKAFQVRGSIGLIEVDAGTKLKDAISTADRACREAKSSTTGLVIYEHSDKAFREREAELSLVERIASVGAPEGLFIDMQPIMSLRDPHSSLNFEALLRMRDRDGSVIPAGRIIAAAESSGRIGIIDRWVLNCVLEWADANHAQLDRTQFICMNLSGASLNDERFVLDAIEMLERKRSAASLLCLEITESVALHDLQNTRRFIDKVREYGVRIALDDFGAGYTSFSYLKDLPADVLKIDGSFIVDMNAHPANVAIVEAIVNLAGNLGMKTIAEWAEDNATVQALVEVGVDYVQGYAVSRPQSPTRILAANSAASFITDSELAAYAKTLSLLTDAPTELPPGIALVSSDGMLLTK